MARPRRSSASTKADEPHEPSDDGTVGLRDDGPNGDEANGDDRNSGGPNGGGPSGEGHEGDGHADGGTDSGTGGVPNGDEGEGDNEGDGEGYVVRHKKKAPPLPGQESSDATLDLEELGNLAMPEMVERIRRYGLACNEGMDRAKLLVQFMRLGDKQGLRMHGRGQLEIMPDGYGFLRAPRNSFLAAPSDLYIAPEMIASFGLRPGMTVTGVLHRGHRKDKYFAISEILLINGCDPALAKTWKTFEDLTPVFPDTRVLLEHEPREMSTRIVDLVAPIGFGQRGLIVSPPRSGKTMMLKALAAGISANYPDARLVMFLVDERPEEVTDMLRSVRGEVIFSTFDEPPQRHVQVAQRVIDRVRSLVESGYDVFLLIDSLTRLGRAFNAAARGSGRIMSGGLDTNALQKPKRLFSSARNIDGGGSLTILASALIDTNSRMDEVIFEEFKGTGNMEIVLSRAVSEQRIYPAIDIHKSGTRNEELLFDPTEAELVHGLRKALADLTAVDAIDALLEKLRKTGSNAEFLLSLTQQRF